MPDRTALVKAVYDAWLAADRDAVEELFAEDFRFSSPADPALDRAAWFDVCWPGAGTNAVRFDYLRLCELPGGGDEALATYVATRHDGTRFQNTELFGFRGAQVVRMEVYFGWDVD